MDEDGNPIQPVTVRPYSAETAAAGDQQQRRPKAFKPAPPNLRRNVEKVSLASTVAEESAGSILQNALRREHVIAAAAAAQGRQLNPAYVPERFAGMSLKKFGINADGGQGAQVVLGPGAASSFAGGLAPRKAKEWKEGKSMDLLDLAFSGDIRMINGKPTQNYAPISLPYFNIQEEDEDGTAGGASGSTATAEGATKQDDAAKKTRPTMKHLDEANANASQKLLGPSGELEEDKYYLIQLPSVLPELANPDEELIREHDDAATSAGAGATITRFPDGKLGKLRIYKSGKVRMEIGGVSFCVDQGADTFFRQDLALVCPLANEFINLGEINNRLVLTPDLDDMFSTLLGDNSGKPPEPEQ
eukprot:TRINITY_DN12974_c2_g1_i1.p1 TRINITY_DN12974_c2_g1~~TRINITY_DN12974_c2_g1_i1.p1  ORF type:complete len:360 (+),score=92.42 TRINITY_DN12974_c2_g1_i1:43-1122(+)